MIFLLRHLFNSLGMAGRSVKRAVLRRGGGNVQLVKQRSSTDNIAVGPLTVFTSIVGGKDILDDNQVTRGASFIAFTDQQSEVWRIVKPYNKFKDDRRNSRIHKIMPHMFFDTEFSIWVDGNVRLKRPAQEVIDTFLNEKDIALWKHRDRDCIYLEAEACYKFRKDTAEALDEQVEEYAKRGVVAHDGLYAATVIIRRHTKRIKELNERWWAEYCRYSSRDQISFPVVFPAEEVHGIEEGSMWDNDFFERTNHVVDKKMLF